MNRFIVLLFIIFAAFLVVTQVVIAADTAQGDMPVVIANIDNTPTNASQSFEDMNADRFFASLFNPAENLILTDNQALTCRNGNLISPGLINPEQNSILMAKIKIAIAGGDNTVMAHEAKLRVNSPTIVLNRHSIRAGLPLLA
ncbi:hypothetical protein C0584_00770 [Candidatus Parcubacteria bacterium]|nr:MAG: hypothetical protein C0584_00770 [Candidatus Parcubacteria bacterium]